MAISSIDTVQDNIVGDCNLLAVHSPLSFIVDATYSGDLPEVFVDIMNITDEVLATFRCVFLQDISATIRRFIFIADNILKAYMDEYSDFIQSADTIERVTGNIFDFKLHFRNEGDTVIEDVNIIAFHAVRQFGQTAALTNIYDNDYDFYITGKNKPVYIYFYNTYEMVTVEITDGTNTYDLGSDTEIFEETFDSWSGVDPESYPTGWIVLTNQSFSSTWRVYESSSGIATFVLHGAVSKYMYLYNPSYEITPGVDNYYLTIRYRSNADIDFFILGYKISGLSPGTAWTGNTLPSSGGAWTEITWKLSWNPELPSGTRYFLWGFYKGDSNDIDIDIDTLTLNQVASAPGYYRLKIDDLTEDTTYTLLIDSVPGATKDVIVKPTCDEDLLVKYLDKNGQYRFYIFNKYYEIKDSPNLIGKVNKFITDILDSQSNSENIGYRNERTWSLVADDVSDDELEKLSDIYTSPQVYLYIGDGSTDIDSDWLEVTVKGDNLVKARKDKFSIVNIDIILPEHFTINKL